MKKILAITTIVASSASLEAAFAINLQLSDMFATGGASLSPTAVGILVASTTDNAFGSGEQLRNLSLTKGATFATDDIILAVITASDVTSSGNLGFSKNLSGPDALSHSGNFGQGDLLAFYWFDTLTAGSTVSSTARTDYGFFRSSTIDNASGGSLAFITPADAGGSFNLFYYDIETTGGSVASIADFTANQFVPAVPEPSAIAAVAGVLAFGLAYRRRKAIS